MSLNTPGQANGWVRLTLDGDVIAERTGLEIRDNAAHKFNNVMFGGWYSNGAAGQNPSIDPATASTKLIDDVKIETSATPGTGQLATSTFDRTPEFRWTPSFGAASSEIFIRNLTTGATIVQKNIAASSWTPTNDLPDGPYRWWVASSTANGFRSNWSAPVDFSIGGRTSLMSPTGTTSNRRPEFLWQTVGQIASYQLWVNRIDVPSVVINQTGITLSSFRPALDLAPGTYRVWVRAVSPTDQLGPWSTAVDFRVT